MNSPIFNSDLLKLRAAWNASENSRGYFEELRQKFNELADCTEGGRWYLPHRIFRNLLDGSPAALQSAKADFLKEWSQGATLDRRVHYWNSLQFRTGDRWICAAMLAQLLILFDWLAAAGVWSETEIDAIGTEALDVAEAYLEPHLKGRGHMPFLPDPINQAAACITGLLYAGLMFGMKWRHEPRGERMYAFARNLVADAIGQFPANGYDTDGFTYLRHIHLQVHTLSIALLEESEGGDWYHRKFAPHHQSLADLNAMQLDFITPSGFTWPLGRYGYVKSWNIFCQSFAARRSGEARFLQVARQDNIDSKYSYQSPWLGMDLVLGLLWYPYSLDSEVSSGGLSITQKRRVIPHSWAVFTNDADRMLAVALWTMGKAPHFFLEAHGSPLIIGGMEDWHTSNCVQCDPGAWGKRHWLTPGGTLLNYCDIPGLQAAYFDSKPTYPAASAVKRATRAFVNLDSGMIVSDRFVAENNAPAIWQAATWISTAIDGALATIRGLNGVTLRAISAGGDWQLRPTPERKPRPESMKQIDLAMLELQEVAGHGVFDVLLDCNQHAAASSLQRDRDDQLTINGDSTLLLPGKNKSIRHIGPFQTDAPIALLDKSGRLSLAAVRSVQLGDIECIWTSCPMDITLSTDCCWISGLKYGEFVTVRRDSQFICIRMGNGIEISGRSASPMTVFVRPSEDFPVTSMECNGDAYAAEVVDGWVPICIPDTTERAKAAVERLSTAVAGSSTPAIIRALHEAQQAVAWEAADVVRQLFHWDASTEPVLADNDLKTEATYVRLEAAATAMTIGDRSAVAGLIELMMSEARRNYAPDTAGFGGQKWWGFSTRSVVIEALMILHANETLDMFNEFLSHDVWPHGFAAVNRACEVLGV